MVNQKIKPLFVCITVLVIVACITNPATAKTATYENFGDIFYYHDSEGNSGRGYWLGDDMFYYHDDKGNSTRAYRVGDTWFIHSDNPVLPFSQEKPSTPSLPSSNLRFREPALEPETTRLLNTQGVGRMPYTPDVDALGQRLLNRIGTELEEDKKKLTWDFEKYEKMADRVAEESKSKTPETTMAANTSAAKQTNTKANADANANTGMLTYFAGLCSGGALAFILAKLLRKRSGKTTDD